VRRNYYSSAKRCQDELRRVDDCLVAFAVVRCALRMTFRHNGSVVWTKAATSDVLRSLAAVVSSKATAAMKHIEQSSLQPLVYTCIYSHYSVLSHVPVIIDHVELSFLSCIPSVCVCG